jgi:hypothetical protein
MHAETAAIKAVGLGRGLSAGLRADELAAWLSS